jgi:hypothetical protein
MGRAYMGSKVVRSKGLGSKRGCNMCGKKYKKLCTVLSSLGFVFLTCIFVNCIHLVCIVVILCVFVILRVYCCLLLLSVGLPVANAPDVLQPCGLLYYP